MSSCIASDCKDFRPICYAVLAITTCLSRPPEPYYPSTSELSSTREPISSPSSSPILLCATFIYTFYTFIFIVHLLSFSLLSPSTPSPTTRHHLLSFFTVLFITTITISIINYCSLLSFYAIASTFLEKQGVMRLQAQTPISSGQNPHIPSECKDKTPNLLDFSNLTPCNRLQAIGHNNISYIHIYNPLLSFTVNNINNNFPLFSGG